MCIDSVLRQTFQDFEIVIVDDGSTDDGYELCNKLYGTLPNVHVIRHEHNLGQSEALNTAIKAARGEYVAILHSDDMFMPNHLEVMNKVARDTKADVVHSVASLRAYPQNDGRFIVNPVMWDKNPVQELTVIPNDETRRFDEWRFGTHIDMWLNLYRREFLIRNDIKFENVSAENNLFAFQWIMLAEVYVKILSPTYIYSPLPDSISNSPKKPEYLREIIEIMTYGLKCMERYMSKMDIFNDNKKLQETAKLHFLESVDGYWIDKLKIYDESGNLKSDYEKILDDSLNHHFGQNDLMIKYYFNKYHQNIYQYEQQKKSLLQLFSLQNHQLKEMALNIKKPKIYLGGFFALNVGDDLFFKILIERYPNALFFVPGLLPYIEIFRNYPNVICEMDHQNVDKIDDYDMTVTIAGSIFQSATYTNHKSLLDKFIEAGKQAFIIGANFERSYVNTNYNEKHFHDLFKSYGNKFYMTLRDTHSKAFFNDIDNIKYFPDVVFNLRDEFSPEENSRSDLGISVISFKRLNRQYFNGILELVKSAVRKNIQVTMFSFCLFQNDFDTFNEIHKLLSLEERNYVKHIGYDGNMSNFLKAFASMKYIVATRFHANILALKFRQPLFPIAYDDKILNLIEDLSVFSEDEFWNVRQGEKLDISKVWEVLENPKELDTKIKEWEKHSPQHFEKLDEFLLKNQTKEN